MRHEDWSPTSWLSLGSTEQTKFPCCVMATKFIGVTKGSKARMIRDLMTYEGAMELAAMIRQYWAERGADVDIKVMKVGYDREQVSTGSPLWGVRSDLYNGLPR